AALVQHGHPTLVLAVVASLLPLGLLARLPRRWFPGWLRQVLQVVVAGAGLAWWRLRMQGHAVDVVLVESAAVLGVALALGGVAREYGLLGLISLVLLGYGGVMPGRPVYLPVLGVYLFAAVLLMYGTRTANLAAAERSAGLMPPPRFVANWGYRLAHLTLACAFFVFLVPAFPLPQGRSIGLIPVGFRTTQEQAFPVLWRQWLQPTTQLLSRGDPGSRQTADTAKRTDPNPVIDPKARHGVPTQPGPAQMDAREGLGGAGIGTDLVMRVQSPAKLYWLAQLYDLYDGKTWRLSPILRGGQSGLDRHQGQGARKIEQQISVEKAFSSRLPGAFRVTRCLWDDGQNAIVSGAAAESAAAVVFRDAAGAYLRTAPPALPWRYRSTSEVPTIDSSLDPASWESFAHQGWNYRRLPDRIITERTRRLAAALTQDCTTPMQKALALQNHLRQHYTYSLTPAPVPEDHELVDHFLFESREGYCQHFAQALTVLARLVGLPARLATGYSPGNHNLLANVFEVYEYHAHAWTQIFIEPYGWLTFDGVAPGNLRLDSGPSFLRRLMDPFGDDWNARPPELTLRAPPPPAPPSAAPPTEPAKSTRRDPVTRLAEDIYARAMVESKSLEPDAGAVAKAAGLTLKEWSRERLAAARQGLVAWGADLWERVRSAARRLVAFARSLTAASFVVLGLVLLAVMVLWNRRRWLAGLIGTAWARWRCRRRWERTLRQRHHDPAVLLAACGEALTEVLRLGRLVRPANLDAMEFAEWLRRAEPAVATDYRLFAAAHARMVFADRLPTPPEAESVLAAVGRIRAEILARLTLTGARRRTDRPAADVATPAA
ncbi:MAG: transglutaminase domain-containing protein, partial [Lentisphaerae bacterium]|nr:transglutaminase domain-containing protein [Lentisphaerota bacterium]